jgi:tetratricopeptide (TPR) repeat protein
MTGFAIIRFLARFWTELRGRWFNGSPRTSTLKVADQASEFFELGMVAERAGANEQALEYFDRAIQYDPDHARALVSRSMLLNKAGRQHEAIDSISRAIKIEPNLAMLMTHRGLLHAGR